MERYLAGRIVDIRPSTDYIPRRSWVSRHAGGIGFSLISTLALIGVAWISGKCLEDQRLKDIASWSDSVRVKLADPSNNLAEGERYYPRVETRASGEDWQSLQGMIKNNTPINVRDYPSPIYPHGRRTKILGTIAQGREFFNVVEMQGRRPGAANDIGLWGGFDCSDGSNVPIDWKPGEEPKPGEARICAVYADYYFPLVS